MTSLPEPDGENLLGTAEPDPYLETKYNAAIEIWIHENQWYWNITTIFALASTFLLGFRLTSTQGALVLEGLFRLLLSLIGVVICLMWVAAAK